MRPPLKTLRLIPGSTKTLTLLNQASAAVCKVFSADNTAIRTEADETALTISVSESAKPQFGLLVCPDYETLLLEIAGKGDICIPSEKPREERKNSSEATSIVFPGECTKLLESLSLIDATNTSYRPGSEQLVALNFLLDYVNSLEEAQEKNLETIKELKKVCKIDIGKPQAVLDEFSANPGSCGSL